VFDNASRDNPERLANLFPDMSLCLNEKNIGFGAAINRTVSKYNSKYIILLNPDALVTDRFIETCLDVMEQNRNIGIMGPMILNEDGRIQGSARAFPTPLTAMFGRNAPLTKLFPNNSITKANIRTWHDRHRMFTEVDWVSGACMIIRSEVLSMIKGFDSRFFLYWEDADLCRRVREAGWKVIYFSGAKIIHTVGRSSRTCPMFSNFHFHKSSYRLYEKYAKWPFLFYAPLVAAVLMMRFLSALIYNFFNIRFKKCKYKKF
jgi:GT2 family glycosyltransferase